MTVFNRDEKYSWRPSAVARGPFAGLQGGGISAVMCLELCEMADRERLGQLASLCVQFYRATPEAPFQTAPEIAKRGRRSSVLTNSIFSSGKLTAKATACFIQPLETPQIQSSRSDNVSPQEWRALDGLQAPHDKPWMMDAFEVRMSRDKTVWFRLKEELTDNSGPVSTLVAACDWAHGLNRPSFENIADPNIDLNIALSRLPQGEWIGINAAANWESSGIGQGGGSIHDVYGGIGAVSMSIALISASY